VTTSLALHPPDDSAPWPPLPAPADAPDPDKDRLRTLDEHWTAGELVTDILDNRRALLRCADAGLGAWLDHALGGGLANGETLAVGAAGAGVGKTALVHQLTDGWAKWSASNLDVAAGSDRRANVVPVVYVTEMGVRQLTIRTLAREAAVPGKFLRAPAAFGHAGEEAVRAAAKVSGPLCRMARFVTPIDRTVNVGSGATAVRTLGEHVQRVRDRWQETADVSAAVLVIDPVHRLLASGVDETRGLSDVLGELLALTQRAGLVTILTSDTTKRAASNRSGNGDEKGDTASDELEQAEQAFRGSYQLMHVPDHVLMLRALDPSKYWGKEKISKSPVGAEFTAGRGETRDEWATVFADLVSPKLRWGKVGEYPSYWYDRALFRFVPIARPSSPTFAAPMARKEGRDYVG
jgi:hypothetical protein